jgi:hypothetical protein
MKHKVVRHGITTHFKEVCQSINCSNLGKNAVEIFAQEKWYEPEDHMKKVGELQTRINEALKHVLYM